MQIEDYLTKEEYEIINAYSPGFTRAPKLGKNPAILAVDFTYSFVGSDEPIQESIKKWPKSAGRHAWEAVKKAARVIEAARRMSLPIYYTAAPGEIRSSVGFGSKTRREGDDYGATTIVKELEPKTDNDHVIRKIYPSAFFGTNLASELIKERIDTLLVMGGTTSGCVRASVVDASSYHLNVGLISDAVFDRIQISNLVNLFDMKLKYADVVTSDEALQYLSWLSNTKSK
ncbi:MAG: isochorismatase family protein [Nitrososphaerales archaeon]